MRLLALLEAVPAGPFFMTLALAAFAIAIADQLVMGSRS